MTCLSMVSAAAKKDVLPTFHGATCVPGVNADLTAALNPAPDGRIIIGGAPSRFADGETLAARRSVQVGSTGAVWNTTFMAMPAIDVDRLTTDERLDLIGRLWDSIGAAASLLPLTPAQREELDGRLDDLEREGPTGTAWDEAVRRIGSSR